MSTSTGFFNCRLKYYSVSDFEEGKAAQVFVANQEIFPDQDCALTTKGCGNRRKKGAGDTDTLGVSDSISRSFSRAKQCAFDYMMCNSDLKMFVTLTFSPAACDRYSWTEIIHRLNIWLDNRVRRDGLKYVLVPEYHKDGAIHFHGLFTDTLPRSWSGLYHNRRKVYNLDSWKYGFTTAKIVRGNREAVVKYIYKYMSKAAAKDCNGNWEPRKIGGRYYLHGGDLRSPIYEYVRVNYADLDDNIQMLPIWEQPYRLNYYGGGYAYIFSSDKVDIFRKVNHDWAGVTHAE